MKRFIKNFMEGIGFATSILCAIAAIVCCLLTAAGVVLVMAGKITLEVPIGIAAAGILLGATAYALNYML